MQSTLQVSELHSGCMLCALLYRSVDSVFKLTLLRFSVVNI